MEKKINKNNKKKKYINLHKYISKNFFIITMIYYQVYNRKKFCTKPPITFNGLNASNIYIIRLAKNK